MENERNTTEELPEWLKKLYMNQERIVQKLDRLLRHEACLGEDTLLDNQDLCLMFKVTNRTLQRLRSLKKIPYLIINGKAYYKTSSIKEFIDLEIESQDEKHDSRYNKKKSRI